MKLHYALMHQWAATPFVWGVSDCCLGLADWYNYLNGKDPAAHLRGQYFDPQSCQRLCGWFTRPVDVISDCLDTVGGLPLTDIPKVGDVGIITITNEGREIPAGAIWLGDCWGCKGPNGVTTINEKATQRVASWEMDYEA